MAVVLRAGLDGIKRKLEVPAPIDRNIYSMTASELEENGIDQLPSDLSRALEALSKDQTIIDGLGEHIYANFLELKNLEWDSYRTTVHAWEQEQYLELY